MNKFKICHKFLFYQVNIVFYQVKSVILPSDIMILPSDIMILPSDIMILPSDIISDSHRLEISSRQSPYPQTAAADWMLDM